MPHRLVNTDSLLPERPTILFCVGIFDKWIPVKVVPRERQQQQARTTTNPQHDPSSSRRGLGLDILEHMLPTRVGLAQPVQPQSSNHFNVFTSVLQSITCRYLKTKDGRTIVQATSSPRTMTNNVAVTNSNDNKRRPPPPTQKTMTNNNRRRRRRRRR